MFSNYRQPTDLAVTVKTAKGPNTRNEKFTAIDMASPGFRLSLDRNEAWHMTGLTKVWRCPSFNPSMAEALRLSAVSSPSCC